MIDREKLAAAREALGMKKEGGPILSRLASKFGGGFARAAKEQAGKQVPGLLSRLKSKAIKLGLIGGAGAGLYHMGKDVGEEEAEGRRALAPPETPAPDEFSPMERAQFARHGLDPERLRFASTLNRYMQGLNLDRKLFGQALSGQLPPSVLGGGDEGEEDVEAFA